MRLCKYGIWFTYKGDEVLYLWPWRRKEGYKFLSLIGEGGFNNLKEIDDFWEAYEKTFSRKNLLNKMKGAI